MKPKSLCMAKGIVTWGKQQLTKWEKTFINYTFDRGLISKIIKITEQQENNPNKKCGTELSSEFSKEETQIAGKHLKICSTFSAIRVLQSKTALRFHLTIESKINATWQHMLGGMQGKGTSIHHWWWECKLVQPPWKSVWQFLRKLGSIYLKTQLS